jgi:hypothetical protein
MASGDWRQEYEHHADIEGAKVDKMSVRELCARIQAGKVGDYYQIWRAIGERGTLPEAGWLLFSVLESDMESLHRYHCASALLRLLGEQRMTAAELSAEWGRANNMPTIAALLEQKIGPRR